MAGQSTMSTPIFDELLREMAANSGAARAETATDAAADTGASASADAATPSSGRRRRPE